MHFGALRGWCVGWYTLASPSVFGWHDSFISFNRRLLEIFKRGNFRCTQQSVGVENQLQHLASIIQVLDPKLHDHLGTEQRLVELWDIQPVSPFAGFAFFNWFMLTAEHRNTWWGWLSLCISHVHGTVPARTVIWGLLVPLGGKCCILMSGFQSKNIQLIYPYEVQYLKKDHWTSL